MTESLRILTIHAHPDDEASKGAPTFAKYKAEGATTVLVCCTGGEEGDVLNPALDRPEIRTNLPEIRLRELRASVKAIGFDRFHMLGYRDSGMPDSEANHNPNCFDRAPMEESAGRLAAILRAERPHVVVTYSDDQQGYQHPDHLKVHDITGPAIEAAADPKALPGIGEPWRVKKLYYSLWAKARMMAIHQGFIDHEIDSPYDDKWLDSPSQDHRITSKIDITGWYHARTEALLAHATQVDPREPFWFGLPDDVAEQAYPYEDFILAASEVPTELPETDLFAGLRAEVNL